MINGLREQFSYCQSDRQCILEESSNLQLCHECKIFKDARSMVKCGYDSKLHGIASPNMISIHGVCVPNLDPLNKAAVER